MWNILNVRSRNKDVIRNDQRMAEVRKTDDPKLTELLDISTIFGNMFKNSSGERQKTLTRDRGRGLVHTLTGLVDLCRTLLSRSHQYVLIGHFTTDPLEKELTKLKQGSGETYFLSFQQVVEKLDISKTKQLLKLKEDVRNLKVDVDHSCSKCCFSLDEVTCEIFDSLTKLVENVDEETKMALVHVAGYVTRNDDVADDDLFEVDMKYYRKYGTFTQSIDRGGLNLPSDTACQWTFYSFIMFNAAKYRVCRTSLSKLFMMISDSYCLNMKKVHAMILSNVFLKNHCLQSTPRSNKERRQKILKLSDE